MIRRFRFLPAILAGMLILVGCRTYGDQGYNSESKTYEAIQETVTQFEQDLGRAQSDLRRLEAAVGSADTLRHLAERYADLVQGHEATLEKHRQQAERLSSESSYRTLHRIYGAMVTDRHLLRVQYQRTTQQVWATVNDTTLPQRPTRLASSYTITPVQYPQDEASTMTMTEALQGLEGTPGLQREEQPAAGE